MSSPSLSSPIRIREIDANSESEISLVARRMRATLVEVEGERVGTALYTMDWLHGRVRWHLNNPEVCAKVLLAVNHAEEIIGHAIVRKERDLSEQSFGLFSTIYVAPEFRRLGIGNDLLKAGEDWFANQRLQSYATWTSSTNLKLIRLYEKHGYAITEQHRHETTGTLMVGLTKNMALE